MKPIIYSGPRCAPCVRLKEWIEQNNFTDDVEIKSVPRDISVEEFFKTGLKTTPSMVTPDNQRIVNSSNIMAYLVYERNHK